MSPSLQKLMDIERPPSSPVATGSPEQWPDVERKLGFRLPNDYKEYVTLYGAGRWADFLGILSPFYEGPHAVDFFKWINTALQGLDEMHEKFPKYAPPFYRYPARGGLVPIGYTDNGGTICWQTELDSKSWSTVCFADKYSLGYDKFETCLTGFLLGLLEKRFIPKTFPPDFFPISEPAFDPYTAQ